MCFEQGMVNNNLGSRLPPAPELRGRGDSAEGKPQDSIHVTALDVLY